MDFAATTEAIADHLSALERSLLDPATRADRERVADLLADNFVEFGSSGRIWSKDSILSTLAAEVSGAAPTVTDLDVRLLADAVALVTYSAKRDTNGESDVWTLRSSVWQREGKKWRMVFHQGTPASSVG